MKIKVETTTDFAGFFQLIMSLATTLTFMNVNAVRLVFGYRSSSGSCKKQNNDDDDEEEVIKVATEKLNLVTTICKL